MESCKINHIVLSFGLVYILATLFYFVMKQFQSNELLELSDKIPQLRNIYDISMKKKMKLFYLGLVLSVGFVYWIKPFKLFIIKSNHFVHQ